MRVVPEPSDEALFAAYRAGDASAFETLFERYRPSLGRHLARMLDDPAAAEDLVVETFLRLHRHRDRWREGTPLRPWTFAIARNLARNRLRSQRLWGWLPLSEADDVREAPPPASDEVQRRVAAAFAELPAAQREACSLRLFGGLTGEEIARVTGASAGTVKSRLFYGLRRLRARLADLSPGK
ncbi:MAG: sigma-70 family RNA polymerase sigma factor [Deltaproteobacteria bacterium]|nr:MAG: sigma-70 family RNA polymerase sigma factor [Deltaproteobacteria bacterium]